MKHLFGYAALCIACLVPVLLSTSLASAQQDSCSKPDTAIIDCKSKGMGYRTFTARDGCTQVECTKLENTTSSCPDPRVDMAACKAKGMNYRGYLEETTKCRRVECVVGNPDENMRRTCLNIEEQRKKCQYGFREYKDGACLMVMCLDKEPAADPVTGGDYVTCKRKKTANGGYQYSCDGKQFSDRDTSVVKPCAAPPSVQPKATSAAAPQSSVCADIEDALKQLRAMPRQQRNNEWKTKMIDYEKQRESCRKNELPQ